MVDFFCLVYQRKSRESTKFIMQQPQSTIKKFEVVNSFDHHDEKVKFNESWFVTIFQQTLF